MLPCSNLLFSCLVDMILLLLLLLVPNAVMPLKKMGCYVLACLFVLTSCVMFWKYEGVMSAIACCRYSTEHFLRTPHSHATSVLSSYKFSCEGGESLKVIYRF